MTMNYKKISKIFIISFVALILVSPSISSAVGNAEAQAQKDTAKTDLQTKRDAIKTDIQGQKTERTCQMISNQVEQIKTRLAERISQMTQKRTETEAQIQKRIAQGSTRLDKTPNWEKLRADIKTDEQKIAVEKFITTIQSAIQVRNEAHQRIANEYRTAVQTANNSRKSEIDAQISSYKDQLATISSQIKTDCAAGKNTGEIRGYFKTELQKTRNEFQTRTRTAEQFKNEITPIREAKQAEFRTALENFKASIESAKTELHFAFQSSADTTSAGKN